MIPSLAFLASRWWSRCLGGGILGTAFVVGASGCLGLAKKVGSPPLEIAEVCASLPAEARGKVYLFLINGLDPFQAGDLEGVRNYVHQLGFRKTYLGQMYHQGYFGREMLRLHAEDPDARFIVVGFDRGAETARALAEQMSRSEVPIDALLLLSPNGLEGFTVQAGQIPRIVSIAPDDPNRDVPLPPFAESIRLQELSPTQIPGHSVTLDLLTRALTESASRVPVAAPLDRPFRPYLEPAPTPRPVVVKNEERQDEWDFLKPRDRIVLSETLREPIPATPVILPAPSMPSLPLASPSPPVPGNYPQRMPTGIPTARPQ